MAYRYDTDPNFNPLVRQFLDQRRAREEQTGMKLVGTSYGAVEVPIEIAGDWRLVTQIARDAYEARQGGGGHRQFPGATARRLGGRVGRRRRRFL